MTNGPASPTAAVAGCHGAFGRSTNGQRGALHPFWGPRRRCAKQPETTPTSFARTGAPTFTPCSPHPLPVHAGAAAPYAGALLTDLGSKAPLFNDDATFIREVAEGRAQAPGMDAGAELELLQSKFEAWSQQFKLQMHEAQAALQTQPQPHAAPQLQPLKQQYANGGGDAGRAAQVVDLRSLPDLALPGLLDEEGNRGGGSKKSGKSGGLFSLGRR